MAKLTPNQLKWVEALESGEYKQGPGLLHDVTRDTWCCLGVACDLAVKDGVDLTRSTMTGNSNIEEFSGYAYGLPEEVLEWLGVGGASDTVRIGAYDAIALNDDYSMSFKEIAHQIRLSGVSEADG